jgi:hypothetical protein
VNYDLSHLTQDPSQEVLGPIQDDEALLLYAVCKVICARHVLEFGGLNGYSARNFLQAVGPEGTVYTVERNPMERLADNHIVISKSAKDLGPHDIWHPCDLVFFDCHAYEEEGAALELLWRIGTVRVDTILAMHDTGEHP